ncbi:2-hydroxyisoflavanone dehydratase-like [Chenopodium quinoa]|uniref:2-hydroxyisoflavanone dehydratase-like n=1 Tax=Chenopodium quinoa TaxID=63459 RepID=UPI000B776187|nr:2-hydroxyisoflavanone dehydratase-like [Chenopodium quinoa]
MALLTQNHHLFTLVFFLVKLLLAHTSTSETILSPIILQPYIIDYRNGTVLRYNTTTPPSIVPPPNDTHVQSKDITFPSSSTRNLGARVFLPAHPDPARKLPVLIYFHGGAFCIGSPFFIGDSVFVARVAAEARVLAIAIDYRLYPEFTVPAPFNDAWAAFKWVAAHASSTRPSHEPWLTQYGDFQNMFVGGDSAGGTIAHNLALRAGLSPGPRFTGLFLAMPYFLGSKRVPLEPKGIASSTNYIVWSYVCDNCTNGVDNAFINPFGPGTPSISHLGCTKLLVYTAEVDELRGRGIWYYKRVKTSQWAGQARWIEAKGETHVFHILKPEDPATATLIQDLSAFINTD